MKKILKILWRILLVISMTAAVVGFVLIFALAVTLPLSKGKGLEALGHLFTLAALIQAGYMHSVIGGICQAVTLKYWKKRIDKIAMSFLAAELFLVLIIDGCFLKFFCIRVLFM